MRHQTACWSSRTRPRPPPADAFIARCCNENCEATGSPMSLTGRHILRPFAAATLALCVIAARPATLVAQTEYETKAKYLLVFAQFTTWRDDDFASKDAPLVIGILGENPFGKKEMEMMKSSPVKSSPVQ